MKPGSLAETKYPSVGFMLDAFKYGFKFVPCLPEPNRPYLVTELCPHPENPNYIVIEFDEFKVVPTNGSPCAWLNAAYWKEVQPPMDLTELLEETKQLELTH